MQPRNKSQDPNSSTLQERKKYYYGISEQQFLQDPTSSEDDGDSGAEEYNKSNIKISLNKNL